MRALVVRSGSRVDRRPRVVRCPCDAFYHMFMFPELDLTIPNDFALQMNYIRIDLGGTRRGLIDITFVSFVATCHTRTV